MKVLFQNNTKRCYSWLKRGDSWSINNIMFSDSINMISAIFSNGYSISLLKSSATTSKDIIRFLGSLLKFIKITTGIEKHEIGVILDNWPTHRSKIVENYVRKSLIRFYFLPAYAPELAPIETYFSRLKSIVTNECTN